MSELSINAMSNITASIERTCFGITYYDSFGFLTCSFIKGLIIYSILGIILIVMLIRMNWGKVLGRSAVATILYLLPSLISPLLGFILMLIYLNILIERNKGVEDEKNRIRDYIAVRNSIAPYSRNKSE